MFFGALGPRESVFRSVFGESTSDTSIESEDNIPQVQQVTSVGNTGLTVGFAALNPLTSLVQQQGCRKVLCALEQTFCALKKRKSQKNLIVKFHQNATYCVDCDN